MQLRSLFVSEEARLHGRPVTRGWFTAVSLLSATVAAVLMRLPGLRLPFERDEGAYAYVASLWLQGSLPYRDVFDHKPPLLYLLYMPPILFGTPGPFALRLWASFLFLLELPLVYWLARRVWDRWSAGLAVILYAILGSAFSLQGFIFNSEQALVLPALLALWALFRSIEDRRWLWPMIYGLCLGLTALIKPTAFPFLLPLVMLGQASDLRGRLRNVLVALAGVTLALAPVFAIWGAAGAMPQLFFALIGYNRLYALESAGKWSVATLMDVLAPLGAFGLCALGGAALGGWRDRKQRQRMALALWTGALFVAALAGLRPYVHYYYPVLPGLTLLAAPTVIELMALRKTGSWWQQLAGAGAPLLLLGVLLLPFLRDNMRLIGMTPAEQTVTLYGEDGKQYFGPAAAVAEYIRASTKAGEQIYVWASEPQIYVLSERKSAGYYIYTYPLDLVPRASNELLSQLLQRPPALVVSYHGFTPHDLQKLANTLGLRRSATIGGYDIWAAPNRAAQ